MLQSEMDLQVKLLGQFEIHRDGRLVPQTEWRTEKNKDLLKILALHPDQILSQDWLMEALWPDQDPTRSVRNLRGRISEVRRILEPGLSQGTGSAYIKTVAGGYTLDSHCCWIDTVAFQARCRKALALIERDTDRAIAALRRAVETYRGELLPADRHKDWTFEFREELHRSYLDALRQLIEQLYRHRHYQEAIRYGERALQADPYDERTYRTLMRAHHEMGNAHAALKLYKRCHRVLAETGLAPSESTELLFDTLRHRAVHFTDPANIDSELASIAERLASDLVPEERWILLGQQIEHLHTLRRQSDEADALRAAEAFARAQSDPGKLGRVLIKWAEHHRAFGEWDRSERAARQAYDQFAAMDFPLGMAEGRLALGRCCAARSEIHDAEAHFEAALRLVRPLDGLHADRLRIRAWTRLGRLAMERQRDTDALAYYDQALRLSQAIGDYTQQAGMFLRLGALHYYRDHVAAAGLHWEQGRQLAHRIGHREIEAKCLLNLAVLKKNEADLAAAWRLYETVIDVQGRLNDTAGLAKSWNNLGIIRDALGDLDGAVAAFETSRQYSQDAGDELGVAIERMSLASVQIAHGRFDAAEDHLHRALEVFRERDDVWYEIQARYYLGELALARGQAEDAEAHWKRALQRAGKLDSRKLLEHVQAALAVVALRLEQREAALEWAERAEATLAETPPGLEDMRVRYRLYRVFQEAGRDGAAERHLRKAHEQVEHLREHLTSSSDREAFERVPLYQAIIDNYRQLLDETSDEVS